MPGTYTLLLDGEPVDEVLHGALSSLEVEENCDLPDAVQLNLAVNRTPSGEPDFPSDARLGPFANVAVVAAVEGGSPECIFDGFVLSHRLHLEPGLTASTLAVWGQDASWLMNLEEKVREWVDVSDAQVASVIFGEHGFTPSSDNTEDDSPSHTEDGHSLMQRGSDIRFLRDLARRNGKLCRVVCGPQPGLRTGYFARPNVEGDVRATIALSDAATSTADFMDFEWDVARPSAVRAAQALFDDDDPDGARAEVRSSGLAPLDERDLATFAGRPVTVLLATPVDDAGELAFRATAVVREAGWFVRCEGQAEVSRVGAVLRANTVVQLEGVGTLHSGKYLVWSVRHTITPESHQMRFVLWRNGMGPQPTGAGAGLGGLL
ncbi:MAG TPA: hypothetical protein VHF27_07915 [Acidimicrobiales bacterium]|nr:hypothetical protein [Acidimicrobiales bacterium]